MILNTTRCSFANADELIECATCREPLNRPQYIVRPILRQIPSLAVRRPEHMTPEKFHGHQANLHRA